MTDKTQMRPNGPHAIPGTPAAPNRGSGNPAAAAKPSGAMTYVVQKGADIVPS